MANKRFISSQPFYRKGVYYHPGTVIVLEEGEKPGKTWTPAPADPVTTATKPPEPESKSKGGRASDRDVA